MRQGWFGLCRHLCETTNLSSSLFFLLFFVFCFELLMLLFFVRAMSLLRNAAQSNHAKLVVSRDAQSRLVYAYCTYIIAFNNVILRI